jgi:NAD(P)-dependent dehydrogenase (short-subunit alcohol dehydrogenase family)
MDANPVVVVAGAQGGVGRAADRLPAARAEVVVPGADAEKGARAPGRPPSGIPSFARRGPEPTP